MLLLPEGTGFSARDPEIKSISATLTYSDRSLAQLAAEMSFGREFQSLGADPEQMRR